MNKKLLQPRANRIILGMQMDGHSYIEMYIKRNPQKLYPIAFGFFGTPAGAHQKAKRPTFYGWSFLA